MNQPGWGQYGQAGYQQPPPKKGMSGCMLAVLVVGGLVLLGFGGCVVCVAIGVVGSKTNQTPTAAAVDAGPARAEAPWVAALVQLSANPKSIKAKLTDDDGAGKPRTKDKDVNYEYDNPPGVPIKTLNLSVSKVNPAAWEFSFEESDLLTDAGRAVGWNDSGMAAAASCLQDLAPSGALSKLPANGVFDTYEITDTSVVPGGPLKGSIVEYNSPTVTVMSLPYAVGEGIRWVCENRVPGARSFSDFKSQCEDMVRAKLIAPKSADFPGLFDGTQEERNGQSTPGCGWKWYAWVEATNAFNATIRHKFTCEDDPKTRAVSLTLE